VVLAVQGLRGVQVIVALTVVAAVPGAPWSRRPGPTATPPRSQPSIQKRRENLPRSVQDIAWKAQVRLCKRFRRLTYRGKHSNVAVTAIARELIAFMWAIAKEVPVKA
jgi:hypothetical protein